MTWTLTLLRWTARLLLTSIDEAIDWDEVDVAARFDDKRLAEAIDWDEIDIYDYVDPDEHLAGPVDRLHQLVDDHDRAYVWEVPSEEAEQQVTSLITEAYQRDYGRDPDAAHFVVADLEQLRQFDRETVRMVEPVGGDRADA